jgi:hypothetical protein
MNLPRTPTTEVGTVSGVVRMAWPWPPKYPENIYSAQLEDGKIELSWDQHGRIIGQLMAFGSSDVPISRVVSCPLALSEPSAMTICVIWNGTKLEILANNELIASTNPAASITTEFRVTMNRDRSKRYDFSAENEAALKARRDRLVGHGGTPLKEGRQRSTKDGVFDALRDEIMQIDGLLELVQQGGFQHAIGLSAIARKVLATGSPLPLVQISAAFIDAPLIIYTAHGGRRVLPADLPTPTSFLAFTARAVPELLYENPVDLDVWLDTPAGQVGGKHFTQRELIKKIGDTLGSHFDLDVHPAVPAFKASRSLTSSGEIDFLVQYVSQAVQLARHLGLAILNSDAEQEG